jgi:DNA-binding transcriptional ArsR family regulator
MELSTAVKGLSALAQDARLSVFRLLVRAGAAGMAAGDIARALGVTPNTLSAQLNLLGNAGLVRSRRRGRSIIYSAEYETMSRLLVYLADDCCQCRAEICQPLAEVVLRSVWSDPLEGNGP